MKPLFVPIKPTLIPTISAVLCNDFSLGVKEHDDTDKQFPLRAQRQRTNTVPYIRPE